jgi:uncharacterized membrane protein YidH (DUF202 family)
MPKAKQRTKSKKRPSSKTVVKYADLPAVTVVLKNSLEIIKKYWKTFLIVTLVYALLYIVFVRGISGGLNLSSLRSSLNHDKGTTSISTGLSLFAYLIGNSTTTQSSSVNAGVYQTILLIIVSLALIWTLRQSYNDNKVRARDAFYKGMYPVIPFILVLLVIGLELIPLLIGGSIYATVTNNGIAVGALEKMLWVLMFAGLSFISLYLITSSIFALYIVTLPDMTPMKALRSARQLVKRRRWLVMRKMLFLPLVIVVVALIIMVPIILLITAAATWIFLIFSLLCLVFIHSYLYSLYRELINE